MLTFKSILLAAVLLIAAMPGRAAWESLVIKNIVSGYGSSNGTTGYYVQIKSVAGDTYVFNSARTGFTEERARAILSVALAAKATKEQVSLDPTCVNSCSAGSSTLKIFSFSEIILGQFP